MRPVAQILAAVAVAAVSLAACSASETGPGPEAPPLGRPDAASLAPVGSAEPAPVELPHLALATLARDPSSPSDSAVSAHPVCPDGMALIEGEYCTEVREDCVEWRCV